MAGAGESSRERVLRVVTMAALVLAGGALVYVVGWSGSASGYTEFYVLAEDGTVAHPSKLRPGEEAELLVGVSNKEGRAVSYRIAAFLDPASGSPELLDEREARLEDGASDRIPWSFRAPDDPGPFTIRFELRREGDPGPYRELLLRLDVVS